MFLEKDDVNGAILTLKILTSAHHICFALPPVPSFYVVHGAMLSGPPSLAAGPPHLPSPQEPLAAAGCPVSGAH
eukprot:scaffold208981_cov21-Prasinocladus_malaysianus.AAC.1